MGGLKLRTDHLTFVGRGLEGMGDFRKKKILQLTSREKKSCKEKCGKSILTQTKSPIQPAPMVDPLRRCLNIRRSYTLVETFFLSILFIDVFNHLRTSNEKCVCRSTS